ncbi:MAG: transposase [Bacteroidota bacterium]|nr:transposase [Bacteroidota bacterium]
MARREIQFLPECFYHIYNRGNNQEIIFTEDENYIYFLKQLHDYFDSGEISLLAYCLMPNHFHLLISPRKETDFPNIMQSFSISYAKAFNKWQRRSGHVFQGNYQARSIEREGYLSHLYRYFHLNPLKASLVSLAEDWKYSDYKEWISENESDSPKMRFRRELFGTAEDYRKFMTDFVDELRVQKEIEKLIFG